MGFRDAQGRFHPIRASDDYDPEDVGERYQWKPAKKKKKRKKNVARANSKGKKLMKSGSKKLREWVKSQTKTNRRTSLSLPRGSGETGWLAARQVNVVTRNGRVAEVRIKR